MTKLNNAGIFLLKLLITVAVLWWIVRTYGWTCIVQTVSRARLSWLAAALACSILSIFTGAWQWAVILKNRSVAISVPDIIRLYFIGMFLNNFVLGMVSGDIYRVASIHFEGREGRRGLAATFLDRLAGLITLSAFAIAGGAFILHHNIGVNKQLDAALAALALFGAIFLLILLLVCSTRLQELSRRWLGLFAWVPGMARMQRMLAETFMNLHTPHDRMMFFGVALLSILTQSLRIGVHILCAVALGIFSPLQIFYFFVIVPVIALMMIVPLPLGVKEAAAGTLFSVAGFAYHEALVMEFLATLAGIAGSLPGGAVFLKRRKAGC